MEKFTSWSPLGWKAGGGTKKRRSVFPWRQTGEIPTGEKCKDQNHLFNNFFPTNSTKENDTISRQDSRRHYKILAARGTKLESNPIYCHPGQPSTADCLHEFEIFLCVVRLSGRGGGDSSFVNLSKRSPDAITHFATKRPTVGPMDHSRWAAIFIERTNWTHALQKWSHLSPLKGEICVQAKDGIIIFWSGVENRRDDIYLWVCTLQKHGYGPALGGPT